MTAAVPSPGTRPRGLRLLWALVSKSIDGFSQHRDDLLAAALAFHALLSISPLIIVAVAVAGIILGQGAAQREVLHLLNDALGPSGASTVHGWVQQASEGGAVASVVGILLTLFGATRFGAQLQSALNHCWNIDVYPAPSFKSGVRDYAQRQLFSLTIALATGPLLLLVFASRTVLSAFHERLFAAAPGHGVIVQLIQLGSSLVLMALVCTVVFRYVPDVRVAWRHVAVGGAVTSLCFNFGNSLVGLYLGRASVTAAYGAAGSLVVVLLWLYFSAQVFLMGAEFTRVYSER
jgi:membrane protein